MSLFKRKTVTQQAAEDIIDKTYGKKNDELSADEIMRKYDKESQTRIWEGAPKIIIHTFMALFSLYCIGMTLFSTALPETRLSLFLGFIIIIGYLNYPANKSRHKTNHIPWYDIIIMLVGAACFFYFAFRANAIIMMGSRIGTTEIIVGILGILVLTELCRRCVGIPIIIVAACLIIYAFYNQFSYGTAVYVAIKNIVYKLFYTTSGIIGTPINVCYTYIVLFIIFGAFLERTGIAQYFISFANRIAGWSSGGAAKVAVISSALCGMVSGSSVGNTVTTGAVTIPMMKKTGYKPEFAGAVEAASSTGGQIMPPIMGAAAFIMAEYTGIPYLQVAAIAIIPALLYFTGIFMTVHLEAKKSNLKGIPMKDLPKAKYLLVNIYLIIPLVLLVVLVGTGARTMAYSAALSILCAFIVGFINFFIQGLKKYKGEKTTGEIFAIVGKEVLSGAFDSLVAGARSAVTVAVACSMAGIIAGCITVTGLASLLINVIVGIAGNAIILGLILTMLCCIVLGMGVPTTANYCIMASTCAPILIQLGIPMVAAHFFVFYFGIVADITPPVALAAYAGSAIAKSRPMKTAFNATRLAIAAFIVPYIFAFNPQMLFVGDPGTFEIIQIVLTSIIGLFAVAVAMNGHLFTKVNPLFRILFAAGGLCMMVPDTATDVIGLILIVALCIFQFFLNKKKKEGDDSSDSLSANTEPLSEGTAPA